MPDALLRKIVLTALACAILAGVVRALRGEPAPQFSVGIQPGPGGADADAAGSPPAGGTSSATATRWAEPVDGACPEGFPVKAKLSSGIYHVPGGLSYERTRPDRCYATAEDALTDGLRAAKR